MARNEEEVLYRRRRGDGALLRSVVLPVRHHQKFVRHRVFLQKSEFQEVRSGDLHFFDFIQVRPPISIQRVGTTAQQLPQGA
jgi:hypothetical protein